MSKCNICIHRSVCDDRLTSYYKNHTEEECDQFIEEKKGKWVRDCDDWVCSVCGSGTNQPALMGQPMFEYCPLCGAELSKGDEK